MKKQIIVLTIALTGALAPLCTFAADPAPATPAATPAATPEGRGGRGGRGARMTPEARVKDMKDVLSLTDDQASKLLALYQGQAEKIKALRDDTSLSQEDRRAKMREIAQGSQPDVEKILTPDQVTKWKAEMEKRRAARGQ